MSANKDPREAMLDAAEACKAENYERAEDALLEAVSRVRYRQRDGGNNE